VSVGSTELTKERRRRLGRRRERVLTIAICEYGAGNVRSVELAFARLGVARTDDVGGADLAVLPGVGSARAALAGLRERGHDEALRDRFERGAPILGICLGLQLALDWSDEDGGIAGLGLVPGRAVRLRQGRVPRIGWARVDDGDAFYFAHSYAAETAAATAWSEGVAAEVRHGSFLGCQFHPEKSGAAGARYLEEALSRSLV
jgi:imidazole glycerol phosphate synthase glutamine amidotransferase subunit